MYENIDEIHKFILIIISFLQITENVFATIYLT